jgi:hypothetical protein
VRIIFTVLALFVIGGGLLWVFVGIEKDEDDLDNPEKDSK